MSKTAERTDPHLWETVKTEITESEKGGSAGQWSARKAQLAVREYKKRGGGYKGLKSQGNSLVEWTREHSGRDGEPTKAALMKQAKILGIQGRASMDKGKLKNAIRLARH